MLKDVTTLDLAPGARVTLEPGESLTLEPFVAHAFWAEGGATLAGEVSLANDDRTDNYFLPPLAARRRSSRTRRAAMSLCAITRGSRRSSDSGRGPKSSTGSMAASPTFLKARKRRNGRRRCGPPKGSAVRWDRTASSTAPPASPVAIPPGKPAARRRRGLPNREIKLVSPYSVTHPVVER